MDDNTPYMIADNVDDLITSHEQAFNGLFEWFKNNLLKINAGKSHLLLGTNDRVSINVDGSKRYKSNTEKPLSVKFDKSYNLMIISLTSVKKQVEKCLL